MALQKNFPVTHKTTSFQEKMTLASLLLETMRIIPSDDPRRQEFITLLLDFLKREISADVNTTI